MLFLWQRVNEGDSVPLSSSPDSEAIPDGPSRALSLGLTDEIISAKPLLSYLGSEQSNTCLSTFLNHILRPYRGLHLTDMSLFKEQHTES